GSTTLTAGSLAGAGSLAAQGDISAASGYGGGAAGLVINGAGAQTFTGAATPTLGNLPALTINKPSGTLSLVGTLRTTRAWTYTAGGLAPGASSLVLAGTLTISGSQPLNNLELRGVVTVPAGTTLTLAGSFTHTSGAATLNGSIVVTGAT